MWLLKSEQGIFFHVAANKEHTVGRKNGSLTLSDDQSISRLHAKFHLVSDAPNSDAGIILIDQGSKYGTYVNEGIGENRKINANENTVLKHSDSIRFGLQWHKYTVIYMPLLVVVSSLSKENTAIVESVLKELNGELSKSWSPNCTHFVMSAVTVSVKTVCALATAKHIVTPEFFQVLKDAVNSGSSELPDPKDFIPESAETVLNSSVVSFAPNPERSTLFDSLTFVATTPRQMSRLKNMILSAGGRVVLFSECNLSKKDMCCRNVLLMQNSSSSSDSQMSVIPDDYHHFAKYLTSKGYRCIPESDIGMSMVYCSIEQFCNPMHNPTSSLIDQRKAVDTPSVSAVIVPETQNEPSQDARPGPSGVDLVINETIPSPVTPRSSKRLRASSTGDEEEGVQKIKCGENQSKVKLSASSTKSDTIKQKQDSVDYSRKENGVSPQKCKDTMTAPKAPALRNRTLRDMFGSKNKSSNKVEESQITEVESPVTIEKSNLASRLKQSKSSATENPAEVECIGESDNIVIEESESFSFDDYAKKDEDKKKSTVFTSVDKIDVKKKPTTITSVDMFDCCSSTPKESKLKPTARKSVDMFDCSSSPGDAHNFLEPDVPKKKNECAVNSESDKKEAWSTKSVDMFGSSLASSSSSTKKLSSLASKKKDVKESSDKDFDFSDEDDGNYTKKSLRSVDMFETTTTGKVNDSDDDFEFEGFNQTTTSNLNSTRSSNHFNTTTTRKSKRNQDDFDFPDEDAIAPSQPKRTRQSSIFSGSLFSDAKKATIKTERSDSVDDDDANFAFGSRNKKNVGKICLTTFIDRRKQPDKTRDGDENEVRVKDEPIDSDDSGDEKVTCTYSADIIIMPMLAKLNDMNISENTPKDENSNEINYKRFKKNKVAGSRQLPKIIKVSFIDIEDEKDDKWQTVLSEDESEKEIDDDFEFDEIKSTNQKAKKKLKR
ncbi:hypothetical protein LSTR_LSTR001888 [Laodelphax striatellus]|uniref:FHA domain-containing protein n=1 Tax=Laodelphax striatellus TaxID=195883 RepID=A0A482WFZ7_LAOST|nr:hypothetical protein LSTR_LSTR001888 [Laodelphax striatellus]